MWSNGRPVWLPTIKWFQPEAAENGPLTRGNALEPPSSYIIMMWLSQEQSGFNWRLKAFSGEIIMEIHPGRLDTCSRRSPC